MNNREQVTGTGPTVAQPPVLFNRPTGSRKTRPFKAVTLGVVEETTNNEPAGQTLLTRMRPTKHSFQFPHAPPRPVLDTRHKKMLPKVLWGSDWFFSLPALRIKGTM